MTLTGWADSSGVVLRYVGPYDITTADDAQLDRRDLDLSAADIPATGAIHLYTDPHNHLSDIHAIRPVGLRSIGLQPRVDLSSHAVTAKRDGSEIVRYE